MYREIRNLKYFILQAPFKLITYVSKKPLITTSNRKRGSYPSRCNHSTFCCNSTALQTSASSLGNRAVSYRTDTLPSWLWATLKAVITSTLSIVNKSIVAIRSWSSCWTAFVEFLACDRTDKVLEIMVDMSTYHFFVCEHEARKAIDKTSTYSSSKKTSINTPRKRQGREWQQNFENSGQRESVCNFHPKLYCC